MFFFVCVFLLHVFNLANWHDTYRIPCLSSFILVATTSAAIKNRKSTLFKATNKNRESPSSQRDLQRTQNNGSSHLKVAGTELSPPRSSANFVASVVQMNPGEKSSPEPVNL